MLYPDTIIIGDRIRGTAAPARLHMSCTTACESLGRYKKQHSPHFPKTFRNISVLLVASAPKLGRFCFSIIVRSDSLATLAHSTLVTIIPYIHATAVFIMTIEQVNRIMSAAQVAPRHYDAGYVALSYFVSLIGSLSTLQLLQLRTSGRGLYNWYLLFGSSVTMGGIGMYIT
jgi:hypothetical protein